MSMIKIATIAVLLLVAWFGFNNFSSKDSAALRIIENDIAVLSKAVRAHYTRKGTYPQTLEELENGFILKVPSDPYGNSYHYSIAADGGSFMIEAKKNAAD